MSLEQVAWDNNRYAGLGAIANGIFHFMFHRNMLKKKVSYLLRKFEEFHLVLITFSYTFYHCCELFLRSISTEYSKNKRNIHSSRFIGEEESSLGKKVELTDAPTWIIDPIDGTMNFVHGLPHTCISIALLIGKTTEIGIVYNPILEQLFTARKGQGAFMNGAPIQVSGEKGN